MSIIYDYDAIAQRMTPDKSDFNQYDIDADIWAKNTKPYFITVAASMKLYEAQDDWDDEAKQSALIVNARIRAARRLLESI